MEQFLSLPSQCLECPDIILTFLLQFVSFIGLCDPTSPNSFLIQDPFPQVKLDFQSTQLCSLASLLKQNLQEISFEVGPALPQAVALS